MSMKIGMGRGKKGDGLHVDRVTKKRTYGQARNASMLREHTLVLMLGNPNTRPKDLVKVKKEIIRRNA